MNLTPSYRPRFLPKRLDTETPLAVLFVVALFSAGLYFVTQRPTYAPQPVTGPRLELVLSGVLTSQVSLSEDGFSLVRCTPTGFHLKSAAASATMGLELRFRGPEAGGDSATYLLGVGVGPLSLRTGYGGASSSAFSSHSGSVTKSAGAFSFSASLTDLHGQPLLVSGRLVCPDVPG